MLTTTHFLAFICFDWSIIEFHKTVKSNEQINTLVQPPFLVFLLINKFVPKPNALQIY
jgi:hypothetical protein